MDEDVPKTGHFEEAIRERRWQDPVLDQHLEDVAV
jgi:hypothetical protein